MHFEWKNIGFFIEVFNKNQFIDKNMSIKKSNTLSDIIGENQNF